ncbi:MAG: putative fbxl20 [Chlamydiales bacterium]|jgi:hypothetical protein|nr:putative fbxl20 [Chlamydiales bacterium]
MKLPKSLTYDFEKLQKALEELAMGLVTDSRVAAKWTSPPLRPAQQALMATEPFFSTRIPINSRVNLWPKRKDQRRWIEKGALAQAKEAPCQKWDDFNEIESLKERSNSVDFLLELALQNPLIEKIDLAKSDLSDAALLKIAAACPHLKHLNVENCPHLTANALMKIAKRGQLQSLNVSNCSLHDPFFLCLAKHCPHLETLHLAGCPITEQGLIEMALHCKNLAELDASNCPGASDRALIELALHCPRLRVLRLIHCPISSIALNCLRAWNIHPLKLFL